MGQRRFLSLLPVIVFAAVICRGVSAQEAATGHPDYDAIAQKMVNYALEVRPGEVVIITGTPAEMDILSALVVAVSKAGGQPTVQINIPEANKRAVMETPPKFLKIIPTYQLIQARAADCFIFTGSINDPELFADVPEDRLAIIRQANMPVNEAFSRARYRSVSLGQTGGIPTPAFAKSVGAKYEEMLAMFWKSVDTDYDKMLITGQNISGMLKPKSMVKVTSTAGTDLTFKISDIPARINCGRSAENNAAYGPSQAWLPAGEVYACVDPASATGTMVVPTTSFRGKTVKNLELTFKNGRIAALKADENGDLIEESLKMSTGDKDVFSLIDIGINPDSQPLKGSDYYSWEMAGMVTAGIGLNTWAGGDVISDTGLSFHLANSIISVDGNNIVTEGRLGQ